MSESMIERVAHHIALAESQWDDFSRHPQVKPLPSRREWIARAAIAAMREPTEEMLDAGLTGRCHEFRSAIGSVWDFMIDAALK